MKKTIIFIILNITFSLIEYAYAQRNKCGIDRFECKNGQCIAGELLCDGRPDCKDQSDETSAECNKPEISCPTYAFRCSYGACVDGDATCNGVQDCIDNSDETLVRCTGISHNTSTSCAKNQFKCDNGQCIAKSSLCDGTADCTDNSDETFIQCGSIICPQFAFRCYYGACINGNLKCNGVTNCVDGSDEDPRLCGGITTVTPKPPIVIVTESPPLSVTTSKSCIAPLQPQNGNWKLWCKDCEQGVRILGPGAYLIYNCNRGYKLEGPSYVFCDQSGKLSDIPHCTEIRCKGLESASTIADCTYHGRDVSCTKPVLPDTVAELQCRAGYKAIDEVFTKNSVRCNENGEWDSEPIHCIPECGISPIANNFKPLIVNSTNDGPANITEFPWHATLYKAENPNAPKTFICGATIIRESLLVTAAHCVYDEIDPSKYYIATGNIFRDYDDSFHDLRIVKKAKVKNIYIPRTYQGLEGNYAADIAILEITQPFIFTTILVPICLETEMNKISLFPDSFGKVAGFGRTNLGQTSSILQSITVPFVPFEQCMASTGSSETRKYITDDKFCAGYTNGSSVCDGDSGGGLVFQKRGLWYLKGIVSVSLGAVIQGGNRFCDSYKYSLYTDVSKHLTWIIDTTFKAKINPR